MPEEDKIHLILIIQKLCTMIAELTSNDPADAPSDSRSTVFGIVQQLQQELAASVQNAPAPDTQQ
jgi:hypothetical protein